MSDEKPAAKKPAAKPAAKKPAAAKPAAAKPTAAAKPAATRPSAVPPPPPAPPAPPVEPPPAATAPPAYPVAVPLRPDEERNISMLSHLISLLAILLSASWIAALIFYLVYKDRGPFVRQHTATELNFQLTLLIGYLVGGLLFIVLIGILIVPALFVIQIVFGIIATMRANQGLPYEYPVAIRFVR